MTSILVFIIVISILVFFHELGHFVAAKLCGIYVDRFSVGMPPRIFGVRWGETDYCIGALPIGGYVKMAGQEDAPLSEEERDSTYGHVPPERWFNKKPVYQRIFVLVAGPFMNILLGFVLYTFLFVYGQPVVDSDLRASIGAIQPDSPAAAAPMWRLENPDTSRPPDAVGWRTGDVILEMDGKPVRRFEDVLARTVVGGTAERRLIIERHEPDGSTQRFLSLATPKLLDPKESYPRYGIAGYIGARIAKLQPDAPALAAGLAPGDELLRANGTNVDFTSFRQLVEKVPDGSQIALEVRRDGAILPVSCTARTEGRLTECSLAPESEVGPEQARPVVASVTEAYSKLTGLQRRDVISAVDGRRMTLRELQDYVRGHAGGKITVEIARPAILFGLLQREATLTAELPVNSVRAIGVELEQITTMQSLPLFQAIPRAWNKTVDMCFFIFDLLKALVVRNLSMSELGGPIMIFQVTASVAEVGIIALIGTMAFISINLGVFNLFPLPVLDGGQIVINIIEGIRRKPLSMKILELYQQVGLVMIIALMLFVTWNDIVRTVQNMLP